MRSFSGRRILIVATVLAGGAVGTAAVAYSRSSAAPPADPAILQVSNNGVPVEVSPAMRHVLEQTNTAGGSVRALGQEGGGQFYIITGTPRGECHAVGSGSGAAAELGSIACDIEFPTEKAPVLDFSVIETLKATGETRFVQIRGFASDGVATVEALNGKGAIVAKIPVSGNLYAMSEEELNGQAVVLLTARDPGGAVVYQKEAAGPSDGSQ